MNKIKEKPSPDKNPIDLYVGSRLRTRRLLLGLTQEELGKSAEVTFQQIQKYEKGENRISASRLYEFAQLLKTSIDYFFDGIDVFLNNHLQPSAHYLGEAADYDFDTTEIYTNKDVINLIKAFTSIDDPNVRRKVISLVRTLADLEEEAA